MVRSKVFQFFLLLLVAAELSGQYYDFPFPGWQQTFTSYTWTGVQLQTGIGYIEFTGDSIVGDQMYITNGANFYRSDNGRIYQNVYEWQTQEFSERLEYDFSLEVGDPFVNYNFGVEDSLKVVSKDRIVNMLGDSVWKLEIEYELNWIVKDTIVWVEGVGNLSSGLIKTNFPDGGFEHSCTHLADGRKLYENVENTNYCNCEYAYGVDNDNDGFGNYIPKQVTINLAYHFNNPSAKKYYKVRACDTLTIRSIDLDYITIYSDKDCTGEAIDIDEFNFGDEFDFVIFDISDFDKIYLSRECEWDFAEIVIQKCFTTDCDDDNPLINSSQLEEPYNGLDDDCNPDTPDDDLDQDGFALADDCDDNNPSINPNQIEEPYNGLDDDCDSETLDDDLDQDGFALADDCNDEDAQINPNIEEIPNNGIDEDCDGMDLVTSVSELSRLNIDVFPNPVSSDLHIRIDGDLSYRVKIYSLDGKQIYEAMNQRLVSVQNIQNGIYILEIQDQDSKRKVVERIIVAR